MYLDSALSVPILFYLHSCSRLRQEPIFYIIKVIGAPFPDDVPLNCGCQCPRDYADLLGCWDQDQRRKILSVLSKYDLNAHLQTCRHKLAKFFQAHRKLVTFCTSELGWMCLKFERTKISALFYELWSSRGHNDRRNRRALRLSLSYVTTSILTLTMH